MNPAFTVLVLILLSWTVSGQEERNCGIPCPRNYAPVCGSDGITYPNECAMIATACEKGKYIGRVHVGPCRE